MAIPGTTALSDFSTVAAISEAHSVWLVQHIPSKKFFVRKELTVYNAGVYEYLTAHPIAGVPKVYLWQEQAGQCTVIEDYIPGDSLQEKIDGGTLTKEEFFPILLSLCDILTRLHTAAPPLIHRDIKPSNIIITPGHNTVLLDFNAARQFSEGDRDTVLLGTQGYAAPEQYGFGASSPQTDLYAFGILMREMLSALGSSDASLEAVAARCTRLEPGERFSNAGELKQSLLQLYEPSAKATGKRSLSRFTLPGFRSRTPWKMLVGSLGYGLLLFFTAILQIKDVSPAGLWTEKLFFLLFSLSFVAGTFNYLNVQNVFLPCRSKNRFVRILSVILLDCILAILVLILLYIAEHTFIR